MDYFSYLCKLCKKNGKTTMAQIEDDYATSIIGDPNAC